MSRAGELHHHAGIIVILEAGLPWDPALSLTNMGAGGQGNSHQATVRGKCLGFVVVVVFETPDPLAFSS